MENKELPQYQCIKIVGALKITGINPVHRYKTDKRIIDHYEIEGEGGLNQLTVSCDYMKHKPESGGYYVEYADGYTSYSPAQAFEDGYVRLQNHIPGITPLPAINIRINGQEIACKPIRMEVKEMPETLAYDKLVDKMQSYQNSITREMAIKCENVIKDALINHGFDPNNLQFITENFTWIEQAGDEFKHLYYKYGSPKNQLRIVSIQKLPSTRITYPESGIKYEASYRHY